MIINLENDQQKLELSAQVLERLQEGLQAVARLNELPEETVRRMAGGVRG
jgi:hypothetical protein